MFQLMANILAWFYSWTHDYAAAIALLTLTVMVLLLPLTLKATKSMIQMQRLQPEIKRLQQQHKGDRQKLNEELMRFYQENKINPLGGCLPMLLQLPVFFVIYRVIRKLTTHGPDGKFKPSYLAKSSLMYKDLTKASKMLSVGLDLSQSAVQELRSSFGKGVPYLALVLVVAGTSYYQQRQIMVRSKSSGQAMNQQQVLLLRIMPAFFALISLTFPSALIVYFLVSNLFRIIQQSYITRRFYHEGAAGPISTTATEVPPARGSDRIDPAKAPPPPKAASKAAPKPKPKPSGGPPPASRPRPSGRVTPPKNVTPPKKKS
jgi:YidC/Oxa1 family membrane protein insertase